MPRSGPQRSKCSISTVFRVLYYPPRSVLQSPWWPDVLLVAVQSSVVPGSRRSPGKRRVGKRGPRSRGGAAATERTSAQQVFHRYSVRGSLKTSALPAAESLVTRCPFGCRPVVRGFWLPAFAGKTRGKKAGTQEPRWRRCHEADLSAAGLPPAQCPGSCPFRFPRESGGLGAAVAPRSRSGPQRSGFSAGTVLRFS